MRIARFVTPGGDPEFGIVELAADQQDHPDTIATITGDPLAGPVNYTGQRHGLDEVRLLSPVIPRSKVVGVGDNYYVDDAQAGGDLGAPLLFLKPNTSVIGPDEAIVRPAESRELGFEGELAVVIGRICRKVPRERAHEVIFGYTCANDVTAIDLARAEKQWSRAKGSDTFCPLGPWIVTHLTLDEAGQLMLTTTVDGEVAQHASTRLLKRPIDELISYISGFTTLLPGDVILTGTPIGAGPVDPGRHISIEIEQIGTLHNVVVADDAAADS